MDTALVTSVAAMLSGIGACASAVATWRTVREMQRQREASWLPDIACSIPVFTQSVEAPKISICNVGLGVARDVLVEISVPLKEFLPDLNRALQNDNIQVREEGGYLETESVQEGGGIAVHALSIPCATHIKYLFPGADSAVNVRLPGYFHELVGMITERAFVRNEKQFMEILKKLRFTVHVGFSDVGGKKHAREYLYAMFDAFHDHAEGTYSVRFK